MNKHIPPEAERKAIGALKVIAGHYKERWRELSEDTDKAADFLEKEGWDDEVIVDDKSADVPEPEVKLGKKELRKLRSDIIARKSKELGPLKKEIDKLESEIESCEEKIDALNQAMMEVSRSIKK